MFVECNTFQTIKINICKNKKEQYRQKFGKTSEGVNIIYSLF